MNLGDMETRLVTWPPVPVDVWAKREPDSLFSITPLDCDAEPDGDVVYATLDDLIAANDFEPEEESGLRSLTLGQALILGGGAAQGFSIKRLR